MPSRHGSEQSLSPPTHSLLYTMDMDMPTTQHPSLSHLERYDMYEAPGAQFGEGGGGMGMGPVRPKRKQVKNACSACQRACKRCDVGRPCERCIKYGMADSCRDSQRKERKKGIKRGPYKKRDGMTNDQRLSPRRIANAEVDLSAANLIQIDVEQPVQPIAVQSQVQAQAQVQPSVRPEYYPPVVINNTPPLSLAGMPQYNTSQPSSSYQSEDQYYPRYDQLQRQYRTEEQDYSRHAIDYNRSPVHTHTHTLQYPSPEHSPPRERQYTNSVYDNSSRSMVQPVHHDPSYQSQSDSMDHETHDSRVMDPYYHHQRPYSEGQGHMPEVHQQDQYYSNYNAYQQQSSYSSQQYGYSQGHVSQTQMTTQSDAGYQHLNYQSGSSVSYPTHQIDNSQYPIRSPTKMAHRGSIDSTGMVAHPHHHHPQHQHHHSQHVGNVQIQSN